MDPHTLLIRQIEPLHRDAYGWALHCCAQDPALAEDVLQEAYAKLAHGRVRHDGAAYFKAWWFGVIRLTAKEQLRKHRRHEARLAQFLRAAWPFGTETPDAGPSPARCVELSEESAQVRQALGQLPARQAEVIHLVFYQNLALREAAEVMGVGIGSARQHYERGKQRLRGLLQPLQADE